MAISIKQHVHHLSFVHQSLILWLKKEGTITTTASSITRENLAENLVPSVPKETEWGVVFSLVVMATCLVSMFSSLRMVVLSAVLLGTSSQASLHQWSLTTKQICCNLELISIIILQFKMTKLEFHRFPVYHFSNIFNTLIVLWRVGATSDSRSKCLQTRRINHQVKYWHLNANTSIVAAISPEYSVGAEQC